MMPWTLPAPEPEDEDLLKAVADIASKTRVLIATPTRGRTVNDNHRRSVDYLRMRLRDTVLELSSIPPMCDGEQFKLIKPELMEEARVGVAGILAAPHDLARTRDRFVRMFLDYTTADWLLFWDDDVWCHTPNVALTCMITAALATDTHVLGGLYPRKQRDEQQIVEAVLAGSKTPLQDGFTLNDMRIWRRPDCPTTAPHPWLMPVNGVGCGFLLISREAAIALTERYRASLSWNDRMLGGQTVGLFNEILESGGDSFSEDYSFCIRAEAGGFSVMGYIGPESPLIHDGDESFQASRTCLTRWRKAK